MENFIKKRLISHKKLAQERTILANERNTLAYIRTGFGSFALGLALNYLNQLPIYQKLLNQ